MQQTDLLIIGAGPFGLSLAAYARYLGIEHLVAGKPMEFWKNNMPQGMCLRSASDWSLDPTDRFSIVQYMDCISPACPPGRILVPSSGSRSR